MDYQSKIVYCIDDGFIPIRGISPVLNRKYFAFRSRIDGHIKLTDKLGILVAITDENSFSLTDDMYYRYFMDETSYVRKNKIEKIISYKTSETQGDIM